MRSDMLFEHFDTVLRVACNLSAALEHRNAQTYSYGCSQSFGQPLPSALIVWFGHNIDSPVCTLPILAQVWARLTVG